MKSTTTRWGWLLFCALFVTAACDSKDADSSADKEGDKKEEEKKEKKKKKDEDAKKNQKKAEEQCDSLGNACGKKDEYKTQIAKECKEPLATQVKKGCTEQVIAALKCYEKEICPGDDEVRAYDDFRVLTGRHKKCADEMKAANECMTKGDD